VWLRRNGFLRRTLHTVWCELFGPSCGMELEIHQDLGHSLLK